MKKSIIKKIMALVVVLTMVMGLSLTTFAATPSGNYLTVPVTVEVVALPSSYTGPVTVDTLYNNNVTINLNNISEPTAMDFIDATGLTITKTGGGDYIYSISGVENYDEIFTSNHYKGYSWMINFLSGSSVTSFGTVPGWASVPSTNSWFSSSLAATNVYMNGNTDFYFNYPDEDDGFTTSVEGILVQYVLTDITWGDE